MKIKKKLRDLTEEEFYDWGMKNCLHISCDICPFKMVDCNLYNEKNWVNNKDLYSDKFLNQEIEIEGTNILTDKETKYLESVIKPFRDRVKSISKQNDINGYEYISIGVSYPINKSNGCFDTDHVFLPLFKRGTMYNNMKVEKQYTLEELGL